MSVMPLDGDSLALYDNRAAALAEVVFVGSQFNFSGSLIAATSQELGQITSTVMHSFQDFRKAVDEAESRPAIAILDEPMMRGLAEADLEFLFGLGDVTLGLAFCNECYAVDCYLDDRIRLRATSIFPLNVRLDIWLSIVKLVAHGGNYICPEVIAAGRIAPATESVDDCGLTPRQHDVLRLVADGQSNKRIAAVLGLSIHTVKLHLHNANLRLGARNRTEAAMHYRAMCP